MNLNFTIVIVTHSMQQAARVSTQTAFFHMGNLIEVGKPNPYFQPLHKKKLRIILLEK